MIDPLRDILAPLAQLPAVREAPTIVAQAVRPVRFSTGLRRQWKAARAEASIRAVATGYGQGTVPDLRTQIVEHGNPSDPQAAVAWRCHCDAVEMMPDLNSTGERSSLVPPRTVLARLFRDAGAEPTDIDQDLILALSESASPAILRLALIIGQWSGPTVVRDAYARWFMTSTGLEPTGLALVEWDGLDLSVYREGTPDAMNAHVGAVTAAIVDSMAGAHLISQSILAGRTDTDYL